MFHYTALGARTAGSWVFRQSPVADRQLHVVLVEARRGRVDVYAHEEYNWLRHPIKHAKGVDLDRSGGPGRARRFIESSDLPTDRESTLRRRAEHLGGRIRRRLSR